MDNEEVKATEETKAEKVEKKAERKPVNWKKVGLVAATVLVGGVVVAGSVYLISKGKTKPVEAMAEAAAEAVAAVV